MTTQNAVDRYLLAKAVDIRERSIQIYKQHLKKLVSFFELQELDTVVEDDILDFKGLMKQKYAEAHYGTIMIVVKDFFKFAYRRGWTKLDGEVIKVPKYTTQSHTPVSYLDFTAMCDTLSDNNFSDLTIKVALSLLWWGGLRVSELTQLKTSDFDPTSRQLYLNARKSNRLRMVTWPEQTHKLIIKYLAVRMYHNESDVMFAVTPRTVQRWVKQALSKAGIKKKLSPHSFRHGIIHYLAEKGTSVPAISAYVGHTDLRSTMANYLVFQKEELATITKTFDLLG
jgi:integrase/recombinase XerD